jgi:hypothetical protein
LDRADNFVEASTVVRLDSGAPVIRALGLKRNPGDTALVEISAFDGISGLGKISLSEDGIPSGQWMDFCSTATWKWSANSKKQTLFVSVMDNAGNIAGPMAVTAPTEATSKATGVQGDGFSLLLVLLAMIALLSAIIVLQRKGRGKSKSHGLEPDKEVYGSAGAAKEVFPASKTGGNAQEPDVEMDTSVRFMDGAVEVNIDIRNKGMDPLRSGSIYFNYPTGSLKLQRIEPDEYHRYLRDPSVLLGDIPPEGASVALKLHFAPLAAASGEFEAVLNYIDSDGTSRTVRTGLLPISSAQPQE